METDGQYRHPLGSGDEIFWRTQFAGLEYQEYSEVREEMMALNDRNLVILAVSLLQFRAVIAALNVI